jgi:(1->4)-alpha-D-glucan 1-alpha-D-glucosylmutase
VSAFVEGILSGGEDDPFLQEVDDLVRTLAGPGFVNSLSQTLLKISSPGVPDIYRGTEFWDFSLVDPDNRRPVDFADRQTVLEEFRLRAAENLSELAAELVAAWPDERIKLFVIWRALKLRRKLRDVYRRGDYVPLEVVGPQAYHFVAFARTDRKSWGVTIVPRFLLLTPGQSEMVAASAQGLGTGPREDAAIPVEPHAPADWFPAWWSPDNRVVLPVEAPLEWRHAFTGEMFSAEPTQPATLKLAPLWAMFPVALLEGFTASDE